MLLDGEDLVGRSRHAVVQAGVARTFQIVRPFPDLPVLANVMIPLAASKKSRVTSRAAAG